MGMHQSGREKRSRLVRPFAGSGIAAVVSVTAAVAIVVCACGPSAPAFTEAQVLGGVEIPAETLNHGQRLYMRSCASCHSVDGSGRGPAARNLNPGPRDFRKAEFLYKSTPGDELPSDADLAKTIKEGRIERGMPAWRGIQDTDITALVHFIKTFSPRWRTDGSVTQAPAKSPAG